MKAGLVTADYFPNVGGVAAHVVGLGEAIAQAGHETHVITLPLADERKRISQLGSVTVHRPRIPKAKPFYSWLLHYWLKQFLKTTQLDILHVHGLRPLEATRNLGVPVIFTNHTSGFLKRISKGEHEHKKICKRLAHIQHVLAPSHELADTIQQIGYKGPVDYIPNGVDINRFCPDTSAFRQQHGIKQDEIVILLARRLVEKNGVIIFAEAVTRLKELSIRIVFAGDGPERGKIEDLLKFAGMHEKAIFLGNIPNNTMPEVYRMADISVLPSFMEATSITGLESMACGLPLVGTTVGGIPSLITENSNGYLVPPGDPVTLADAIRKLVQDSKLRHDMGIAARQKVINEFSWQTIAQRTIDIYKQHTI
ncbi:MAG: glycosyltransferase family 4 protein [Gammaproteobacteria bacterium]|nr:glycosyltransferase family 4 protein [Gammaproteobacteria bacterium]